MNFIDEEVERINREQYGGNMPSRNRSVMRSMLERQDEQWGELSNRDYRYGWDEGEGGARGVIR